MSPKHGVLGLVLMLIISALAVPVARVAAAPPPPQDQCAADEMFFDAQSWWTNPNGTVGTRGTVGDDFGHIHAGLCWKLKPTWSGTVTLRIRTILHDNPGTFHRIRIQLYQGDTSTTNVTAGSLTFSRTLAGCPAGQSSDSGATCTWWDSIPVDTTKARWNGWAQVRLSAIVAVRDGTTGVAEEMRNSTGLAVYLNNPGKTTYSSTDGGYAYVTGQQDTYECRGWYDRIEYDNASIELTDLNLRSGVWSPRVRLYKGAGGAGFAVTQHTIALDTDFHKGNPGTLIRQAAGPYAAAPVAIDTVPLANGWHKLALKTDTFEATTGSTNSGVCNIFFEVRNGTGMTRTYGAEADAYVRNGTFAAENYGDADLLLVKDGSSDYYRRSSLRFNIAGIGATSATRATLKLYVGGLPNGAPATATVLAQYTDSWDETTINFNTPLSLGPQQASAPISGVGWVSFDVTSFVSAELASGRSVISLLVRDDSGANKMIEFHSRENMTNRPVLEIVTP